MTDKQIIKTLRNIQKNCEQYGSCDDCRFGGNKNYSLNSGSWCLIQGLISQMENIPSSWDMEEIERINEDSDFYEYMSAEEDNRKIENSLRKEGFNEGIEKGKKEGIKEGIKENCIETARLMKEKGLDSSLIKEITGIDVDTI